MRGSNFQLICWTFTFLLEFLVCDARILRGESEHSKVPSTFNFSQARGKVQVSQGLVTVNSNAEVLATTEQSGDTELVEETNVPIVDDGGKTAVVVEAYNGEGSVDGQVNQISNGQEPVDHLGQPQVISDMSPIIEEPHTEITISAQYCKYN